MKGQAFLPLHESNERNYGMAREKIKVAKDRRIKMCPNEECINHKNRRYFLPEDIFCTICQDELVYACARCGRIFDSEGIDDTICDTCKEAIAGKQAKRKAQMDKIGKHAGTAVKVAGVAATVVGGPAAATIGKAAPVVGKALLVAKPAAKAVNSVAKAVKK